MLQSNVSNRILDQDFACIQSFLLCRISRIRTGLFLDLVILCPSEHFIAELLLSYFITPVLEGSFCELHDIAFVNKRYALASVINGILYCCADKAFGAFFGYRLDADTGSFREADLLNAHLILQEGENLLHFLSALLIFNTCIDIFCVLPENNHVNQLRTLHWRRNTVEVAYGTKTYIQIQFLTQGYVKRTDTPADWRSQRSFDGNDIFTNRCKRIRWKPLAICIESFLSRENFIPCDLLLSTVCFLYSSIKNTYGCFPDVAACTVTFDKWDNRTVRHIKLTVLNFDFITFGRQVVFLKVRHNYMFLLNNYRVRFRYSYMKRGTTAKAAGSTSSAYSIITCPTILIQSGYISDCRDLYTPREDG
ncbi:hypothetical protein D3C71_570970 [compost metagenome]